MPRPFPSASVTPVFSANQLANVVGLSNPAILSKLGSGEIRGSQPDGRHWKIAHADALAWYSAWIARTNTRKSFWCEYRDFRNSRAEYGLTP